jgi:hypothetical protein
MFDLDPAEKDVSQRTPVGETLLGCHRNQLVYPLTEHCVVSDERNRQGA